MLKLFGVVFVIVGCGSVGFRIAANYKQEEKCLRQLIRILDYMEWELKYRLTPLPDLCRQVAAVFKDVTGDLFEKFACKMELQISTDLYQCMTNVVNCDSKLPNITKSEMVLLGKSIGRFDLEGQLKGIESVRQDCKRNLEMLSNNRDHRLRSYQTLGLCAGATLAILLI